MFGFIFHGHFKKQGRAEPCMIVLHLNGLTQKGYILEKTSASDPSDYFQKRQLNKSWSMLKNYSLSTSKLEQGVFQPERVGFVEDFF